MRLPIFAAFSASCVVDGSPPAAPGVQFGDEGVLLCDVDTVEAWDAEVVPEPFVEAPSVTRDRALGAWTAHGVRYADGAPITLAVDIAAADGPVELVRMTPDHDPMCAGYVRTPITLSVDSDDVVATFAGVLELSDIWWIVRTEADGEDVGGTLEPAGPTPLGAMTVWFQALGQDPELQGTGPLNAAIGITVGDDAPTYADPHPTEHWADLVLER
jgi:hypothetical protein